MKKIILNEKTGFISYLPFEIFDKNGYLFYADYFTNSLKKNKYVKFNLPVGVYYLNGSIIKLEKPIQNKEIILPKPERNLNTNQRFKIEFGNNPNKCTIFYDKNLILFDNKFKHVPLYILYFIYFHELGHLYYKTEKYADLYATKKLLELGFNKSQIARAPLFSLSKNKFYRKVNVLNNLK